MHWKNWSGSVTASPAEIAHPKTEAELADIVSRARKLRVVGAGHSFMPLCETDGTLVSLENLSGELEISADGTRAWAPAGWSLARLTDALWAQGASLINQGDVNPQSLAGALATGTHGTGATLGSLSTAARAYRLMLADGSTVTCSRAVHADLFEAQRLSLGLLGVATRIEIDVLPAYHLEERVESHPLDAVAERWDALAGANRHVEFFVFPYGDHALVKTLNPAQPEGPFVPVTDTGDAAFRAFCDACTHTPSLTKSLQAQIVRANVRHRRVGPAYQIFPSDRTVPFEEMEYELPRENGWAALRDVIAWIRRDELPVTFPFEFRLSAADDIWLSPFNGQACISVSMHQYARMPWRDLFRDAEAIFRAHGGRPHWGKRHTLTMRDVERLYPDAGRFLDVRAAIDPGAKFANAHLSELFQIGA